MGGNRSGCLVDGCSRVRVDIGIVSVVLVLLSTLLGGQGQTLALLVGTVLVLLGVILLHLT